MTKNKAIGKKIKPHGNKDVSISGKRIPNSAFEAEEENTNGLSPLFSFKHLCTNHFQLHEWGSEELKSLTDTFIKMEQQSWTDIMKQRKRGLGYAVVDPSTFSKSLPRHISPDVSIIEIRVTQKARLFGYRWRNIFNVIWFDRNHEVYDMS